MMEVPEINVSWRDDHILQNSDIDISVAVSTDSGLVTPVITNVTNRGLQEISSMIETLAKKARDNRLSINEMQGGSITISNLGMFNIKSFHAIINPPQSCILAIGATIKTPVVRDGAIVVRDIMNITASLDHRVLDGSVGAKFLDKLKSYIENPYLMMA